MVIYGNDQSYLQDNKLHKVHCKPLKWLSRTALIALPYFVHYKQKSHIFPRLIDSFVEYWSSNEKVFSPKHWCLVNSRSPDALTKGNYPAGYCVSSNKAIFRSMWIHPKSTQLSLALVFQLSTVVRNIQPGLKSWRKRGLDIYESRSYLLYKRLICLSNCLWLFL